MLAQDMTYEATPEDKGTRLDVFLAGRMPDISRSKIQKAAKNGLVLVNGKPAKPHLALAAGDVIEVKTELSPTPDATEAPKPDADVKFKIIFEDDHLAVVDKPSGLLVHPTVRSETGTLAAGILARWPGTAGVGESPERPGIVHRLDKEASGLMVVAKTQKSFENLKRQFQEHSIEKEYAVLVHGRPPKDSGTVDLAIGRSADGGRMSARHSPMEGDRPAVSRYRIEKICRKAALLAVQIETGRTHQIRAHMKALDCPVVGDPLYGPKRAEGVTSPRLFLHSRRLAFEHPATKQRMEFISELPAELKEVLQRYGSV
jgi:23S rRNA pseudouridine1911/1915/1917 synthase